MKKFIEYLIAIILTILALPFILIASIIIGVACTVDLLTIEFDQLFQTKERKDK